MTKKDEGEKDMKMGCPTCGGTAKKMKDSYRTKYNGQMVIVPNVERFHCSDCGEEFFNPDQSRLLSVGVKDVVREMYGLLPPERVRAIREKLGLTQQDLEALLGQGPKVVTRWESGRVIQNPNADTILRMLDRDPSTLSHLRKIEKDREQAQRRHAREFQELAATAR